MPESIHPTVNPDGTITACVVSVGSVSNSTRLLTLHTPVGLTQSLPTAESKRGQQSVHAGRYFLARCGAQTDLERTQNWQIYFRRPLFISRQRVVTSTSSSQDSENEEGLVGSWDLLLPSTSDPGYQWLTQLNPGATLNLLGPLGQGFSLNALSRNLLLLSDESNVLALLPLIDAMLDRGGRVTLLLRATSSPTASLMALLPLAVEVHVATDASEWQDSLNHSLRWADQLCATLPATDYRTLADTIQRQRFHLEEGFAQMLVAADLVCGFGACLACVVSVRGGGLTRACIHGPVMDLVKLVD